MSKSLQTITYSEANDLLNHLLCEVPSENRTNKGIRNYCMALLMLDAGLRVGEVVQLKADSFASAGDISTSLVISEAIAKRGRQRIIPISERLRKAIRMMIYNVWPENWPAERPYAFYNIDPHRGLTARQVQRIIGRASLQSIGRRIHPHVLRHTFATNLMRTCNIRVVQELLGHKNLSSTQVYTHPGLEDLKNAIDGIANQDSTAKCE